MGCGPNDYRVCTVFSINPPTQPGLPRGFVLRHVLRSSLERRRVHPLGCYIFHFNCWQLNYQIANNQYGTYDHPTSLGDCSIFLVIFATIPDSVGSGQRTNSVVVPSWLMFFSNGVPLYSQGSVPPNCKTRTMLLALAFQPWWLPARIPQSSMIALAASASCWRSAPQDRHLHINLQPRLASSLEPTGSSHEKNRSQTSLCTSSAQCSELL